MEIIKTFPGDKNFHLFEETPYNLYDSNSIRLTQIDNVNEPYLISCFVLLDKDRPMARAALYYNSDHNYLDMKCFCLGNYECAGNALFAQKLISKIIGEAKKLEGEFLIGPMNGSTWEDHRFKQEDGGKIFLSEPEHHLYYNHQFTDAGFKPIALYASTIDKQLLHDLPGIIEKEKEFKAAGMVIRGIDLQNIESELENLYELICESFSENFLYSPLDPSEFKNKYLTALKIMKSENVLIAEDKNGKAIGFVFAFDDLYNSSEKCLIIKTLARSKHAQWRGLGQILANQLIRSAKARNYDSIIHAFMRDGAVSTFASNKFQSTSYSNYILYGKKI